MSAFTPGPWMVHSDFPCLVCTADLTLIARTDVKPMQDALVPVRKVENAANARLIAAAPDLLGALKFAEAILSEHVASSCDMCGGEGGWDGEGTDARMTPVRHRGSCEYAAVTAAIAKAEGRS